MRTKPRTISTIGAILLAAGVEAAPLPGFKLVAETEHFSYYSKGRLKIDVEKTERFLVEVETLLGHQVRGRAPYYRHQRPSDIGDRTGRYDVAGLTDLTSGRIHTALEYHPHEIVHRVAGQMGDPGLFFHEGLAEALTSNGKWSGQDADPLAKAAVRTHGFMSFINGFTGFDMNTSYPVAGSFVSYLIKTRGMDKVSLLFRACRQGGEDRDTIFHKLFGQTIAEAGDGWLATL